MRLVLLSCHGLQPVSKCFPLYTPESRHDASHSVCPFSCHVWDGSGVARTFFTFFAALVGAAMCPGPF